MGKRYLKKEVEQANIEYHTKMADFYDKDQPHNMPENVRRVDAMIKKLAEKCGGGLLLDIGCGTGFVLNIAKKYFDRVTGIDFTQAMLDKVDLSSGNIDLILGNASKMPFNDESFDVCTAYAFLHHLPVFDSIFREVFRCLKRGGIFATDMDPNYYCWREISRLDKGNYSEMLQREISSIKDVYSELEGKYGFDKRTAELAEYQKAIRGGIKEESLVASLQKVGFSEVHFEYQWFLGQGWVLHNVSEEATKHIDEQLRKLLPLSRPLFKYFSLTALKV